jgi:elongation factor G
MLRAHRALGASARGGSLRIARQPVRLLSAKVEDYVQRMRNIGISAHIDSGKTTLTERILFFTGRIDTIHDVRGKDGVGAKMDFMELEREKGITIQSAATHCTWADHEINVIDTPGHVDFTIEASAHAQRHGPHAPPRRPSRRRLTGKLCAGPPCTGGALPACAGWRHPRAVWCRWRAVAVDHRRQADAVRPAPLCASQLGRAAHAFSALLCLWRHRRRYGVPRLAFVNKLDREGANPDNVVDALRAKLRLNAAALQIPIGLSGAHEGLVDVVERKALRFLGEKGEKVEICEVSRSAGRGEATTAASPILATARP